MFVKTPVPVCLRFRGGARSPPRARARPRAREPARGRWTFGFRRLEILAAQVNGLTLLLVGLWIVYSAIRRLVDPPEVRGGVVLAVAPAGVAVNAVATALLSRASRE